MRKLVLVLSCALMSCQVDSTLTEYKGCVLLADPDTLRNGMGDMAVALAIKCPNGDVEAHNFEFVFAGAYQKGDTIK